MGLGDKIYDLAKASITLSDRVDTLSARVTRMDDDLRDVDRRLVKLETIIEIYTHGRGYSGSPQSKLPRENGTP